MKVIVLGASGMMGHQLIKKLIDENNSDSIVALTRRKDLESKIGKSSIMRYLYLDNILEFNKLIKLFEDESPNLIINCVGVIKQRNQSDFMNTLSINAYFPKKLAQYTYKKDIRLIHISTDCIFSGLKGNYIETDLSDVTDLYGISKFVGEVDNNKSITIRTSMIGHELYSKKSLLEWFLYNKNQNIYGYNNAIFSGLTTNELSKIIVKNIIPNKNLKGIYHVSSKPINKYDLLKLVAKIYKLKIDIKKDPRLVIDRSLNSEKFFKETGYIPPSWESMVEHMYLMNKI